MITEDHAISVARSDKEVISDLNFRQPQDGGHLSKRW